MPIFDVFFDIYKILWLYNYFCKTKIFFITKSYLNQFLLSIERTNLIDLKVNFLRNIGKRLIKFLLDIFAKINKRSLNDAIYLNQ